MSDKRSRLNEQRKYHGDNYESIIYEKNNYKCRDEKGKDIVNNCHILPRHFGGSNTPDNMRYGNSTINKKIQANMDPVFEKNENGKYQFQSQTKKIVQQNPTISFKSEIKDRNKIYTSNEPHILDINEMEDTTRRSVQEPDAAKGIAKLFGW